MTGGVGMIQKKKPIADLWQNQDEFVCDSHATGLMQNQDESNHLLNQDELVDDTCVKGST